jgi:hypothetical protein
MTVSDSNNTPKRKRTRKRTPLRYEIGTRVGKKKVSASLRLPNRTGTITGHGERKTAAGAVAPFYLVKTDPHGKIEEWVPGIIYELNTDDPQNRIAFM